MTGILYRPRMQVKLFVPDIGSPSTRVQQDQDPGEVTQLDCRVWRATLHSNSHNEADEAEVMANYDDAGIDPRYLKNAEMYLYMDAAYPSDDFVPSANNLRFLGIACEVERVFDASSKSIRIRALDYTTLFLTAKNYPASEIPDFSQTLKQAWERVCDNTGYYDLESKQIVSTVQRLKPTLQFVGNVDPSLTLGAAVGPRLAKIGKLQVKHGADAWAVWQTAVGSLGLISFIRGDRCIVTTMTDFYSADDPPRMVYGKNILSISELRDTGALSHKNIGIESFDPLSSKTIEAFWPPLELAVKQKKLGASALGPAVGVNASDYEIFDAPFPTTDPAILEQIAKRVWEERSRQELTGKLSTVEMFADTLNGGLFDLVALQSGDRIRIEIDRTALTQCQQLDSTGQREQYLMAMGYSSQMAEFLVSNLDAITRTVPEFQVHSVSVTLDTGTPPGSFDVQINYLNRIDVSGAAQPGTGESTTPTTGGSTDVSNPPTNDGF